MSSQEKINIEEFNKQLIAQILSGFKEIGQVYEDLIKTVVNQINLKETKPTVEDGKDKNKSSVELVHKFMSGDEGGGKILFGAIDDEIKELDEKIQARVNDEIILKDFHAHYRAWIKPALDATSLGVEGIKNIFATLTSEAKGLEDIHKHAIASLQAVSSTAQMIDSVTSQVLDAQHKKAFYEREEEHEAALEALEIAGYTNANEIKREEEEQREAKEKQEEEERIAQEEAERERMDQAIQALENQMQQETNVKRKFQIQAEIEAKRQEKIEFERAIRKETKDRKTAEKETKTLEDLEEKKKVIAKKTEKTEHDYTENNRVAQEESNKQKSISEITLGTIKLATMLSIAVARAAANPLDFSAWAAIAAIPIQIAHLAALQVPQVTPAKPWVDKDSYAQGGILPRGVYPPISGGYQFTHSMPDHRSVIAEAGSPEAVMPLNKATFSRLGIGGEQKSYTMNVEFNTQITSEIDQIQFMEQVRDNISEVWEEIQREENYRNPEKWI